MMKYGKAFGGKDPELIEGDIFRIVISCPEFVQNIAGKKGSQKTVEKILKKIKENHIFTLCGLQVMMVSNLAKMDQVEASDESRGGRRFLPFGFIE